MHRVRPESAQPVDLDDDALALAYALPSQDEWRGSSWIRVNFVMSLDGAIVGGEGLSKSLGTPADRQVFRLARSLADVLLVGAQTIRAEDYSPSLIPVAIVTRSLAIDASLRMFAEQGPQHARPIILTTDEAAGRAPAWLREAADIVACGIGGVEMTRAVDVLAQRGLTRILCEGGPALLDELLAADLVDELLLTIVPRLVGSPEHLVQRSGGYQPAVRMTPTLVLEHEGTVLTQYRRA